MAQQSALRELQARLAARLQAAQSESAAAASWLAVSMGGARYLIPLVQSGEIFGWQGVNPVPYTQPWFLGVANLRGTLVGIVNLPQLLGLPHTSTPQALAESSLLALGAALEMNTALLIDHLSGLRSQGDFVRSESPAPGAPVFFGSLYTDAQGAQWQEINLQALSEAPEFLNISE